MSVPTGSRSPDGAENESHESMNGMPPGPSRPRAYVGSSVAIVLGVLIVTEILFSPSATEARRIDERAAEARRVETLNGGIHQGRTVRRDEREQVHLRFENRTEEIIASQLVFKCVALTRNERIMGEGRKSLKLADMGPIAPGASRKLTLHIDDLPQPSYRISCSVGTAR